MNNLVDRGLVNKLYGASTAGVQIKMIIRGMCSLVPGIEGLSDNIRIISIVDRFLEHPRVLITHNDGNPQVYISSADWMTRNIDYRIEVMAPIRDERLKQRMIDIINLQFTDTVKARVIDKEMSNRYIKRGNRKKVRSQLAIYDYLKNVENKRVRIRGKQTPMNQPSTTRDTITREIAAIDLGSNSFHMVVAKVVDQDLQLISRHKQRVRLASGLDAQKNLDNAAIERGLECLAMFAERLQGFDADNVRIAATHTLRQANNAHIFCSARAK